MLALHEEWTIAGYDPDAFWGQTPATFASAMRGAVARIRREAERDVTLAYKIGEFVTADRKKLGPLEAYLPRFAPAGKRAGVTLDRLKSIAARTAGLG